MANFKDQFVFLMERSTILRYSLTHHIEEESLAIPGRPIMDEYDRACSLGNKVYVFTEGRRGNHICVLRTTRTPPSPPKRCIGKCSQCPMISSKNGTIPYSHHSIRLKLPSLEVSLVSFIEMAIPLTLPLLNSRK